MERRITQIWAQTQGPFWTRRRQLMRGCSWAQLWSHRAIEPRERCRHSFIGDAAPRGFWRGPHHSASIGRLSCVLSGKSATRTAACCSIPRRNWRCGRRSCTANSIFRPRFPLRFAGWPLWRLRHTILSAPMRHSCFVSRRAQVGIRMPALSAGGLRISIDGAARMASSVRAAWLSN